MVGILGLAVPFYLTCCRRSATLLHSVLTKGVQMTARYLMGLVTLVFVDARKKDFVEMLCHHVVTLALLVLSHNSKRVEIGSIVYVRFPAKRANQVFPFAVCLQKSGHANLRMFVLHL